MMWLEASGTGEGIAAAFCFAGFGGLFIATLLANLYHFGVRDVRDARWIRFLDGACLLPYWGFFAPNPGVYSYRLLVREVFGSEGVSQWRQVPVAPPRNQRLQLLWNPHGRLHKALLDVCNDLIESGRELREYPDLERQLLVRLSIPYIKCLDLVSRAPLFPGARCLQFAVVQLHRDEAPRLLLLSAQHGV